MWHILYAAAVGFIIAVTSESIAVLCVSRTLQQGCMAGIASGLGIASADGAFSALALLGIASISSPLIHHHRWLSLGGGVLMLWFGWKCFAISTIDLANTKVARLSYVRHFTSCFILISAHPMTIVLYTTIFSPMAGNLSIESRRMMVAGVFFGSLLWWIVLSVIVRRLQVRLIQEKIRLVSRICGCLLVARALFMLKAAANI